MPEGDILSFVGVVNREAKERVPPLLGFVGRSSPDDSTPNNELRSHHSMFGLKFTC